MSLLKATENETPAFYKMQELEEIRFIVLNQWKI